MNRSVFTFTMLLVLGAVATGCNPSFTAITAAPPGKVASLNDEDHEIVLSRGVAVAVECTYEGPCGNMSAVSTDAAIAEVHTAYLDSLEEYAGREGRQNRSAFVVSGRAPGSAAITVRSSDGDVVFAVTVLDD